MAAITWQNVNAPAGVGAEAGRGMYLGQMGINQGFDNLAKILQDREKLDSANWNQVKTNNTNAYLNELSTARTPEELAAKQSILAGMQQNAGAQIDATSIRAANDGRGAILQNRLMAENAYKDSITNSANKPIKEQAAALFAAGDVKGGNALLATHPEITDTAALITAGFAGQKSLDARTLDDALRPGAVTNALAKQGNETVQLNDATRVATEAATQRRLDTVLSRAASEHMITKEQEGKSYGKLAELNGIPVDRYGAPTGSLTKDQLFKMDHLASSNGLRPYTSYMNNDTQAADSLLATVQNSKEFTPEFIQKNRETIRKSLDTTGYNGKVGDTKAATAAANAEEAVVMKEREGNTWYAPGSPTANTHYEDIAKMVPDLVAEPEDRRHVFRMLNTMATKGIKTGDGSYVVPSKNDMISALRSSKEGVFFDHARATNTIDILKKRLNSETGSNILADAEELKVYNRREEKKKILNSK